MVDLESIVPLHHAGMADYHCHCDYSFDAIGTIEEYCEAATKRHLAELCFTTHYDCDPLPDGSLKAENHIRIDGQLRPISAERLGPYCQRVREAHDKFYAEGLSVRLGLEFGWFPGCEEEVVKLKERFDFDYLLCGVHNLDAVPLEQCYLKFTLEEVAERYFRQAVDVASSGLFDTLAHADYYKRHGLMVYGEAVREAHKPYIEELFAALKTTDTCLEVNTAAMRHGHKEYYPSMDIVNSARSAGVLLKYVGSDAHRPEDVGFDFEAVEAVVPPYTVSNEG